MENDVAALREYSGVMELEGADIPAELLSAAKRSSSALYEIVRGFTRIGAALIYIEPGDSYITVYVSPPFRGAGVGSAILCDAENMLKRAGERTVTTSYADNGQASAFAEKFGYSRCFSSVYMSCCLKKAATEDVPVRGYTDADYEAAHDVYARAFNRMRLLTGEFPDSVPEQPDAEQRAEWAKSAEGRFVYDCGRGIEAYAHIENNDILTVAVAPESQGRGIGAALVKRICGLIGDAGYTQARLFCLKKNPALRFYEKLGFKVLCVDTYARKTLLEGIE